MNIREIIRKKSDGGTLEPEEIRYFVKGYTASEITDYHAAAFVMAVFLRGMDRQEVLALTREMRDSGDVLDLSSISGKKIDKHSTGGVGDKTSLIVAPIAAACGITVPMITGRALGHTGGTIDKLHAIPGFDCEPIPGRVLSLLSKQRAVLMGQTKRLAPADRLLYALRDAIGAVESIPLITSSILSKKLAEGIDGLVLDVKTGSGALLPSKHQSRELARYLLDTCRRMKVRATALITDMQQPLGRAVGNAVEVRECIDVLKGSRNIEDLRTVSLALAAEMIRLDRSRMSTQKATLLAEDAITSGRAYRAFLEIVAGQGGDIRTIEDPKLLPRATHKIPFESRRPGYIVEADAKLLGLAAGMLGSGRVAKEDIVDPAVGLYLHKKVGDRVRRHDVICDVHWNENSRFQAAFPLIEEAFRIGERPPRHRPLIHAVLRA